MKYCCEKSTAYSLIIGSVLFLLSFHGSYASSTVAVQPFQMNDNRTIWGVLIRKTDRDLIIAFPSGVETIRKNQVMISGKISRESAKIDELLRLIEKGMNEKNFTSIARILDPLKKTITDFEKMTDPVLQSTVAGAEQKKACIRQAISYYHRTLQGIPPSMRCLQYAEEVKTIQKNIEEKNTSSDITRLTKITFIWKELASIDQQLIPQINREKEHTMSILMELFLQEFHAVWTQIKGKLLAEGEVNAFLSLLDLLRSSGTRIPEYEEKSNVIFQELLRYSKEFRQNIQASSKALSPENSQTSENVSAKKLLYITEALIQGQEFIFGSERDILDMKITHELKKNQEILDAGKQTEQLYAKIQRTLKEANEHTKNNQFNKAIKQLKAIDDQVAASPIPLETLKFTIRRTLLENQAKMYLAKMDEVPSLSNNDIAILLKSSESFLQKHRSSFSSFHISPEVFATKLEAISTYQDFLSRYQKIQDCIADRSQKCWLLTREMIAWLEDKKERIDPHAFFRWKTFLRIQEKPLYRQAEADFFRKIEDDTAIDEIFSSSWKLLISYHLDQNDLDNAWKLVKRTLSYSIAFQDKQIGKNVVLEILRISDRHEQEDHLAELLTLYRTIENFCVQQELFPLFHDNLAKRLTRLGEKLLKKDKTTEVFIICDLLLSRYEKPVDEILEKTIQRYIRIHPLGKSSSETEMVFLEKMAKRFPQVFLDVPWIKKRSDALLEKYYAFWRGKKHQETMKVYEDMQNNYPHLYRAMNLFFQLSKKAKEDGEQALKRSISSSQLSDSITSLQMIVKKFPPKSYVKEIPLLLAELRFKKTTYLVQRDQVRYAVKILKDITKNHPVFAEEKGIEKQISDLRWQHRMEAILVPLGIKEQKDAITFIGAIFLWCFLLLHACKRGKEKGNMHYRMLHFGIVFSVFLILLFCFLHGNYSFLIAYSISFLLPGFLYQSLGFSSYLFFPVVYCERILNIEKVLLTFIRKPYSKKSGFIKHAIEFLQQDIKQREKDLPLLHDKILYRIENAAYIASSDPQKGFVLFKKLHDYLKKELVKTPKWKKHYHRCLYYLGKTSYTLGKKEESLSYLQGHIKHNPRHVDSRIIIGDILFESKNYQGAIPNIRICLTAYGDDDSLWDRLGICYFEVGNYISAYKCFASIKEKTKASLLLEARSYSRSHELQKSIACYQDMLNRFPKDNEIVYYLAVAFAQHQEDTKAMKITSLLEEKNAYYAKGQALAASIMYRKNRLKEANELFVAALKTDANCTEAMVGLGEIAFDVNKKSQARSLFAKVLEIDKEHPAANYFMGLIVEKSGNQEVALDHYQRSSSSVSFKQHAEKHIGRIYFFSEEYEEAVKHFNTAESAGESSSTFLYLYIYALTMIGKIGECGRLFPRFLANKDRSSIWNAHKKNSYYTLGLILFEKNEYYFAYQCIQVVRVEEKSSENTAVLDRFIEEIQFRMIIQFLSKKNYDQAQRAAISLGKSMADSRRKSLCLYYLALCYIYRKKYKEAREILKSLVKQVPNNPRFLYHLVITELGLGREPAAAKLLVSLQEHPTITDNVEIGIDTIRAYLMAKQGKYRNAERTLTKINGLDRNFPGVEYLRQSITMYQVFYLCHLRDSKKIHSLSEQFEGEEKAEVALLHAQAAIDNKQYKISKNILKPYISNSEKAKELFSLVCCYLACQAVTKKNNLTLAIEFLDEIPSPVEEIKNVQCMLSMAEVLQNIDDFDVLNHAISLLGTSVKKVNNADLRHLFIHNLSVLHLKRIILAEGDDSRKDKVTHIWQLCWKFFEENIFSSKTYWNVEQKKMDVSNKNLKSFTEKEVDVISKRFVDEHLADMVIAYSICDLETGNNPEQHLGLLQKFGEYSGNKKEYYEKLKKRFYMSMRMIDKTEEQYKTWDFHIAALLMEKAIGEVVDIEDIQGVNHKLEHYQTCQEKYPTFEAYREAQKHYNSVLIDSLHLGIRGKFVDAAKKLEQVCHEFPTLKEELEEIKKASFESTKKKLLISEEDLKRKFEAVYEKIKR